MRWKPGRACFDSWLQEGHETCQPELRRALLQRRRSSSAKPRVFWAPALAQLFALNAQLFSAGRSSSCSAAASRLRAVAVIGIPGAQEWGGFLRCEGGDQQNPNQVVKPK